MSTTIAQYGSGRILCIQDPRSDSLWVNIVDDLDLVIRSSTRLDLAVLACSTVTLHTHLLLRHLRMDRFESEGPKPKGCCFNWPSFYTLLASSRKRGPRKVRERYACRSTFDYTIPGAKWRQLLSLDSNDHDPSFCCTRPIPCFLLFW